MYTLYEVWEDGGGGGYLQSHEARMSGLSTRLVTVANPFSSNSNFNCRSCNSVLIRRGMVYKPTQTVCEQCTENIVESCMHT